MVVASMKDLDEALRLLGELKMTIVELDNKYLNPSTDYLHYSVIALALQFWVRFSRHGAFRQRNLLISMGATLKPIVFLSVS